MGRKWDEQCRRMPAGWTRAAATLLLVLLAAVVAAGCGGSADDAEAGGVPTLGFMTWRDQTGLSDQLYRACEKASGGRYRIEGIPMGPSVDAAREQLTRRLAAGDRTIDMINLDVIWTAEFADAGWIMDLSERVGPIKDRYVTPALESTFYKDRYWAIPAGTNVPVLYYRSDLVDHAPTSWDEIPELVAQARAKQPDINGFVFQGGSYEGGAVNALEYLGAGGAKVLSEDGRTATVADGDGAEFALTFLQRLMDEKIAPKVVTTYQEEDARLAFQKGDAVFMRNWPYAWALMNQDEASRVQGKFDIIALPPFEGRTSASILGGMNFGIASSTDQPELAWEALECLAGEEAQKLRAVKKGEMPTLVHLYDDPGLQADIPFLKVLFDGLKTGINRPTTPYYNDVTIVIYKTYNDVLNGRISPKDAVAKLQSGIQAGVDGKGEI